MTTPELSRRFNEDSLHVVKPRFSGSVSEYCCAEIRFNEPGRVGKFSLRSREYLREPLDNYGIEEITDMILCFGTRTGKTTIMFAGGGYRIQEKMRRRLFVKPGAKGTAGAENDARTRFIPMCRSSDALNALIPKGGNSRHFFKTSQQIFRNGSIQDWTGSNSVANLASNAMEDVDQDEVDKFNLTRRRDEDGEVVEASASKLADERTSEFRSPKRVKGSTPTLESGLIWVELLKTDLRRRFMPCPHCEKLLILAWSKEYSALPSKGLDGQPLPLAFVKWDDEARRKDNSWDLDRVERSAGYICPHCSGRFNDDKKIWMDENGIWKPTQIGAPRTRGYHLPSMYSSHEQTTVGKLALSFLEGVKSLDGPRNFINSKLAEPWNNQGGRVERIEIISPDDKKTDGATKLIAFDLQLLSPRFWHVAAEFKPSENLFRIIDFGSGEHESEQEEKIKQHEILPHHVGVDSGKFATECYDLCLRHSKIVRRVNAPPIAVGWTPMKGFKHTQFWKDQKTKMMMPFTLSSAPLPHHKFQLPLLNFNAHVLKDMFSRIRRNKTHVKFEIAPGCATDEFFKHLDGEIRKTVIEDGRPVQRWRPRAKSWPNHGLDCVNMLLALAMFHKLMRFNDESVSISERIKTRQNEND